MSETNKIPLSYKECVAFYEVLRKVDKCNTFLDNACYFKSAQVCCWVDDNYSLFYDFFDYYWTLCLAEFGYLSKYDFKEFLKTKPKHKKITKSDILPFIDTLTINPRAINKRYSISYHLNNIRMYIQRGEI